MKRILLQYWFLCLFLFSCTDSKDLLIYLPFNGNGKNEGLSQFSSSIKGDEVNFAAGIVGEAVFIGGSEDWVEVEIDQSISFEYGATLELWFKRENWNNPHSSGAGGQILATLDGVTLKLSNVRSAKNGKWKLTGYVGKSDGQVRVFDKIHEIPSDQWMHAAIVYAPSISKVQLYLDGTLVDEQGDVHPRFYDKFVKPFKVGTWFKKNEAYRGYIDEVKLYNYAKTSKEISDEFKSLMTN